MITYNPGDIILTHFPFTNLESNKKRPALILSTIPFAQKIHLQIIAMITSNIEQARITGDLIIENWEQSGLIFPSLLRLSKVCTIESEIIIKKIGIIDRKNFIPIQKVFVQLYQDWKIRV